MMSPGTSSARRGRQGRLPEGCARLEGEASSRWVASAWYSAPLRPPGELHAARHPRLPRRRWHGPQGSPSEWFAPPRLQRQRSGSCGVSRLPRLTRGGRPYQALSFRTSEVLGTVVFSAAPWHSFRRSLGPG